MTALGAVIEDLVKANNAVDIYEEYFAGKVLITAVLLLLCLFTVIVCHHHATWLDMSTVVQ